MSEWISVKERLPENGAKVLHMDLSLGMALHHYDSSQGFHSLVTHWMPLPSPPAQQLTAKEALREAIDCLESLNHQDYGKLHQFRGREILPRLRAALEGEE